MASEPNPSLIKELAAKLITENDRELEREIADPASMPAMPETEETMRAKIEMKRTGLELLLIKRYKFCKSNGFNPQQTYEELEMFKTNIKPIMKRLDSIHTHWQILMNGESFPSTTWLSTTRCPQLCKLCPVSR